MKGLSRKSLIPQKGDWLTQIHWIYRIFLRKSAISARDYLYKEQSLPTHNRASGCNFYNLALTTNVVQSATWGYADESSIQSQPWSGCRPCCRENSRPVRTPVLEDGHGPWVALRLPTAKCLAKARHHAFQATWRMIFSRMQNFDTPSIIIASSPNTSLWSLGVLLYTPSGR